MPPPTIAGRTTAPPPVRAHHRLISSGVSIEAVGRRLNHASTETPQIHTLLADKIADDEIRDTRG